MLSRLASANNSRLLGTFNGSQTAARDFLTDLCITHKHLKHPQTVETPETYHALRSLKKAIAKQWFERFFFAMAESSKEFALHLANALVELQNTDRFLLALAALLGRERSY